MQGMWFKDADVKLNWQSRGPVDTWTSRLLLPIPSRYRFKPGPVRHRINYYEDSESWGIHADKPIYNVTKTDTSLPRAFELLMLLNPQEFL